MADPPRGALVARLTEKGAALDTQLLFFGLELAALDDDAADALLAGAELERWRHWLRSVRKFRPYVLTEPEEKILTEKSVSGFSAWDRLYDELLGAIKVDLDGTEIGFEEAMAKLYSRRSRRAARARPRRSPRRSSPGLRTRTFIFNTIAARQVDRRPAARLRDVDLGAQPPNDTTDEAVQALIDARCRRYDVVQRYYRLKAKLLGLDRLAFYDRMAPLGEDPTQVVVGRRPRHRRSDAFADFSQRDGRHRRALLPRELDRRSVARRTSGPARSARRTSPASTRTSS